MPCVYFVGAGPGDADLLTVRARSALGRAGAVVHDPGLPGEVLAQAPIGAKIVESGTPCDLGSLAREAGTVVRLYLGDPMFSAAFSEEARLLEQAGASFEVVPGVPVQVAAATFSGLTPDPGEGIVLASATQECPGIPFGEVAPEREVWVAVPGPAVPLLLKEAFTHRTDPEGAVAVVSRPGTPAQRVVRGTLSELVGEARATEGTSVVVFGRSHLLENSLHWIERKALFGKRILVTRALHQAGEFSEMVRQRWGVPLELPLIELRACGHRSAVDASLRRLFAYDWVVFTSVNAVDFTFGRLEELGLDARTFGAARVCAVGPKTADSLRLRGIRADVVPEKFVAESLVEALGVAGPLQGASVLLPRALEAREILPEELQARGARVDVLPLYENVRPTEHPEAVLAALSGGAVDVVTLASSSAARNYADLCREKGIDPTSVPCAVIGPATRETAEKAGLPVCAVPSRYTLEGLLDALEEYFSDK